MYQALYRKYRPQTFDDVVGQSSVTETLKTQLQTGRLSHAYLFTGTRGTGKTSCAKILAKAVNCENPQNGNPCNECAACRSIDSGACMDVLEIDAASNNGVDNVRALRDDAIYTPSEVKKRVYIIDEVHMLSLSAFNALLKIIEEPPEHLIFILATTELHKVPATILSRCQRFSFRRLLPEDIAGRINFVAYHEGIDIEPEAVSLLARLADGALRDGLSLLDQCASAVTGALTADAVYQALGLAGDRRAASIMRAVANHDAASALEDFTSLYAGGKDITAMIGELGDLARDLLILKTAPQCGASMLSGVCTDAELKELLGSFSAGELLRVSRMLQDTAAGFSSSANRRIDAELCLIGLCSPEAQLDAASLGARLSRLEQAAAAGTLTVSQAPRPAASPAGPDDESPPFHDDADLPPDGEEPPKFREKAEKSADELPVGFWTDLLARTDGELKSVNAGLPGVLKQTRPVLKDDTLLLEVDSSFQRSMVGAPDVLQMMQRGASALLGRPVGVRLADESRRSDASRIDDLVAFGAKHSDIFEIK